MISFHWEVNARARSQINSVGTVVETMTAINTNLLLIYFGQFMETDGMRACFHLESNARSLTITQ